MTVRQPLSEVPQVVLMEQAYWASEADLHAEVDEEVFHPSRTLKTLMDELSMASQRMTE